MAATATHGPRYALASERGFRYMTRELCSKLCFAGIITPAGRRLRPFRLMLCDGDRYRHFDRLRALAGRKSSPALM